MNEEMENIKKSVEEIRVMTKSNQDQISELVKVTNQQAKMIDKMWTGVAPVLKEKTERDELRRQVKLKMVTGGVWATVWGLLVLAALGARTWILGD